MFKPHDLQINDIQTMKKEDKRLDSFVLLELQYDQIPKQNRPEVKKGQSQTFRHKPPRHCRETRYEIQLILYFKTKEEYA